MFEAINEYIDKNIAAIWKVIEWIPRVFVIVILGLLVFIAWKAPTGDRAEVWRAIHRLEVNQQATQRAVESLQSGVAGIRDSVYVHETRLNGFDKERLNKMGLFGK